MSEDKKEIKDNELKNVIGGQFTGIPQWKCSNCGAVNKGCDCCKKCGKRK